jgi:hypothetical protein
MQPGVCGTIASPLLIRWQRRIHWQRALRPARSRRATAGVAGRARLAPDGCGTLRRVENGENTNRGVAMLSAVKTALRSALQFPPVGVACGGRPFGASSRSGKGSVQLVEGRMLIHGIPAPQDSSS